MIFFFIKIFFLNKKIFLNINTVSISIKINDIWSTFYNAIITNSSNTNYGKNWSISSNIPSNVKITWCDNFNYKIMCSFIL